MTCPHCGEEDPSIGSVYRDGGSRLYHYGCPVSSDAWLNPEHPKNNRTPEQRAEFARKMREIARRESSWNPGVKP